MIIKILGTGCPKCKKLEQETRRAVETLGLKAEIHKVTDYQEIMAYDVLSTPGLVINETVVSSGRIPSREQLNTLLLEAASRQN